jgi:hypothetical protein
MTVTLTVPTSKIKSRGDLRRPSATPMTVPTSVVANWRDGQQQVGLGLDQESSGCVAHVHSVSLG